MADFNVMKGVLMEITERNKMGTKPVLPLLLSMAFPPMLSMMIQSLYNIVDSMFVARYSQDALTAVSLAFPLQNLVLAVAVGTGVGVNSYIARRLGAKDKQSANAAVTHGLILNALEYIVFLVLSVTIVRPFFEMFTSSENTVNLACDYIMIIMIGSFAQIFHIMVEKTMQSTGQMIFPMILQGFGAVVNIILDPIMIFGLCGFPEMGVRGAAVATVIGQLCAMTAAFLVFLLGKHEVKIVIKGFKFKWSVVKQIYSVGVPSMLMMALGSVLVTALNSILIRFSELAVSVFGVYFKLQTFVFMPVSGINQGAMPIMGYNYGAHHKKRLTAALRWSVLIAVLIMAAGTVLFQTCAEPILTLFNADGEMMAMATQALHIISISYVPAAVGVMLSTLFQAVGKGTNSLIIFLLRQLVILIPVAYIFADIFGLAGIWWAFPVAEIVSSVVAFALYLQFHKKSIVFHENT